MGILCSDRWVVYDHWPDPFARQLCWAHTIRTQSVTGLSGGLVRRLRALPTVIGTIGRVRDARLRLQMA